MVFVLEFEEDCAVEVNGHHKVEGLLEFGVGAFSEPFEGGVLFS